MPRRFTLAQIMARVRQVTDTENDDHVTDAMLKAQISTIYGALFAAVSETGLRYFETRATLTTPGPTANTFAEPDNHFATVGLDYLDPNGNRYELLELMAQERNWVHWPVTGQRAKYYALIDDRIYLDPTPPSGQTYELLYIPQPPDLTEFASDQAIDVVTPDGEAFLTYGVGAIVRARKDQDATPLVAEREQARARLFEWSVMRAMHQPRRRVVQDDWTGEAFPRVLPGSWWYY